MNDRDLLILKYLHTFNNITKTANALFISQPALTARIKQLEQELGTKLIYSSNKGIYLTATGLEAAAFAQDADRQTDPQQGRAGDPADLLVEGRKLDVGLTPDLGMVRAPSAAGQAEHRQAAQCGQGEAAAGRRMRPGRDACRVLPGIHDRSLP